MAWGDPGLVDIVDDGLPHTTIQTLGVKPYIEGKTYHSGSGSSPGDSGDPGATPPSPQDNRHYLKKEYFMPGPDYTRLDCGTRVRHKRPYKYYAEVDGQRYYAKVKMPDKKPEDIRRSDFYRVVKIGGKEFPVKLEGMFKYIELDSKKN